MSHRAVSFHADSVLWLQILGIARPGRAGPVEREGHLVPIARLLFGQFQVNVGPLLVAEQSRRAW